ncbi:MAG: AmmeMemoRadiSam system protein B [Candidatus Aminicenantes bacterium]|nr:AmmeMemoRadiSam system protein B [Candidatus Aminicenantes bacterium]
MKTLRWLGIGLLLFKLSILASFANQEKGELVRQPVFAGLFYDENPDRLQSRLTVYLQAVAKLPQIPHDPEVIIAPHAGYIYSGPTAAYAYALVQSRNYETVVIIGPSHQYGFNGCSIWPKGSFKTPLGLMPVDEETGSELIKATGFNFIPEAHAKEHSLEVQIPFLQKVLPQSKIVPIVMGYPTRKVIERLADGLVTVLAKKKALVVVSTDLSHYLSQEEAYRRDQETIDLIKGLKVESLLRQVISGENLLCGGGGVAAALLYLKKLGEPQVEILRYADSTEGGGPKSQVVGYLAAALYLKEKKPLPEKQMNSSKAKSEVAEFTLSPEEKKELLNLARQAVELYIREKKVINYHPVNPRFWEEKGAFVTIKKRGELRGCLGFIEPILPLYLVIIRCAILAATEDPRFSPVEERELKNLEYEISILTPPRKIDNPREVIVGRHGLIISMEGKKGVLLPQVPVEAGWDRETFLEQVCLKAGLPPNAWRSSKAELFVFEALVFH